MSGALASSAPLPVRVLSVALVLSILVGLLGLPLAIALG